MPGRFPPALFIAGPLGIDFLNSVAIPVDAVVDWIGNGKEYLDWLRQAGLLASNDTSIIRSNFSIGELDEIARRARELREWFRDFVKTHKGKPLSQAALAKLKPLNDLLGSDQMHWSIVPKTARDKIDGPLPSIFRLEPQRRWRTPESLLAPIAEEIAMVICSTDFTYIKACEGVNCILFFYDDTPRHKRRWCSMAVCGNRAKQKASRERSANR
jgi:predicted RNA-binding Zn ribbon-like protein